MNSKKLTATTRPVDQTRALRLLLAWMTGDKLALDVVLGEAMNEPTGTPGLLFALTAFTSELAEDTLPEPVALLRADLARLASEGEQ